jgi:hypothetical protein
MISPSTLNGSGCGPRLQSSHTVPVEEGGEELDGAGMAGECIDDVLEVSVLPLSVLPARCWGPSSCSARACALARRMRSSSC